MDSDPLSISRGSSLLAWAMLPSKPWAQLSVTKGVAPSCCFTRASRASTSSQAGSFGCVGASLSGGGCGSCATRGVLLLPNQALMLSLLYSTCGGCLRPSDAPTQQVG